MAVTVGVPLNVRPGEPGAVSDVTPPRFVPVTVTFNDVPGAADVGLMLDSVGPFTVKLVLTDPAAVNTVTVRTDSVAVLEMVKVAVTVFGFTAVSALTVTPVPDTVIEDVDERNVPVKVTFTAVPVRPAAGEILLRVGAGGVPWNSIAPMSKPPANFGSGRGLPKKSVLGAILNVGELVFT